jgi:hypothetical protein
MASQKIELIKECRRQYDNCLYTATSLYIWLRWLRIVKLFFNIAPIVLGAFGSWRILATTTDPTTRGLAAAASFLGGLFSTVYSALKLDTHISEVKNAAGELTNLKERFRQAGLVSSKNSFEQFDAEFGKLQARVEKIRMVGLTPPDLFFKLAQRKIGKGDYSFDIDAEDGEALPPHGAEAKPKNLLKS